MRFRSLILLLLTGFATLPLTHGQVAPPPAVSALPTVPLVPIARTTIDPAKLDPTARAVFHEAQRGAEWLLRMNNGSGRFRNGLVPSLAVNLEGDDYLRQAGAAFAMARAARVLGEERYAACAAQALLSLTDETVVDPNDSQIRYTSLPSFVCNRLGTAGLLVLAIHEQPSPTRDLLDRAEQLCNYIRRQARPDGSLACGDWLGDGRFGPEPPDAANQFPAMALYGLMRSAKLKPAAWKAELVRKAVGFYMPWWRGHQNVAFVAWQIAVCAEAFLATRDRFFADAVFEMADWLAGLQSDVGGFNDWADGRVVEAPSTVLSSAPCAEAMALACRAARQVGDANRAQRYLASLGACLRFLEGLQYSESNTAHFVPAYRPTLVGGFHASAQDGTLRIDFTQHAVSAMMLFLEVSPAR